MTFFKLEHVSQCNLMIFSFLFLLTSRRTGQNSKIVRHRLFRLKFLNYFFSSFSRNLTLWYIFWVCNVQCLYGPCEWSLPSFFQCNEEVNYRKKGLGSTNRLIVRLTNQPTNQSNWPNRTEPNQTHACLSLSLSFTHSHKNAKPMT